MMKLKKLNETQAKWRKNEEIDLNKNYNADLRTICNEAINVYVYFFSCTKQSTPVDAKLIEILTSGAHVKVIKINKNEKLKKTKLHFGYTFLLQNFTNCELWIVDSHGAYSWFLCGK